MRRHDLVDGVAVFWVWESVIDEVVVGEEIEGDARICLDCAWLGMVWQVVVYVGIIGLSMVCGGFGKGRIVGMGRL